MAAWLLALSSIALILVLTGCNKNSQSGGKVDLQAQLEALKSPDAEVPLVNRLLDDLKNIR